MGKIVSAIFSDEAIPKAKPAIHIPAGNLRCIRVKLYSEGRLTQVVVSQQSGTPVDFKVEVLKSKIPYPPDTNKAIPFTPLDNVEIYRVLPQQSGTAGVLEVTHEQMGWPYLNFDGDYTNNESYLYLVIIPTSAGGETVWDVAITVARDVG